MSDERLANAVDRRMGQRLKARRLELAMSQERLAELLGVTFQQIQKYEKGLNRIAASRLYDMSTALDVPVGFFFEGLAESGSATGVREDSQDFVFDALASPEGLALLKVFSSIKNPKVRRRIVELVRALADEDEEHEHSGAAAKV